jgi:hypothetical protein
MNNYNIYDPRVFITNNIIYYRNFIHNTKILHAYRL